MEKGAGLGGVRSKTEWNISRKLKYKLWRIISVKAASKDHEKTLFFCFFSFPSRSQLVSWHDRQASGVLGLPACISMTSPTTPKLNNYMDHEVRRGIPQ